MFCNVHFLKLLLFFFFLILFWNDVRVEIIMDSFLSGSFFAKGASATAGPYFAVGNAGALCGSAGARVGRGQDLGWPHGSVLIVIRKIIIIIILLLLIIIIYLLMFFFVLLLLLFESEGSNHDAPVWPCVNDDAEKECAEQETERIPSRIKSRPFLYISRVHPPFCQGL
jgi:hypothetical protein